MATQTKKPNDELDKFLLRMPDGLRERIKAAAERNNRSMNSEIIDSLEKLYPAPSINIDELARFLASINGSETTEEDDKYLETINDYLSKSDHPFTMSASWDGVISFYPYATPAKKAEQKQPDEE
ncbi:MULTISPECIES: Arc family DNA-binding protein [Agrobacterium]|uniref:Arc family DNA-binding protein n=1 Tax=Agrobacterium TaxID=357 RepID=UPI003D96CD93